MSVDSIYDVTVIGPGIWVTAHLLGANAQDEQTVKLFKGYWHFLSLNFPCEKCRVHIEKFLKTHPFENYTGDIIDGKEIGYFRWTWYMHSVVNERLGKTFFPFDTAYHLYFEKENCMEICPGVIEDVVSPLAEDKSRIIMQMSKHQRKDKRKVKVSL
jgi:hypothetical protein